MRINRPGKWLAVTTVGAIEQKQSGSVQFNGSFVATHELVGGQWTEINPQMDINGFLNIVMKNGSPNEKSIEKLRDAYGWDGSDPTWLQDTDLSSIQVQITTDWEDDQNGVPKIRMKWIYPAGRDTAIKKADESTKRGIREQFGAKFRALSGGTSATPPVPPRTAPPAAAPAPIAPPAPPTPPKPPTVAPSTYEKAFEAFVKAYQGDAAKRDDQWWFCLGNAFGKNRAIPDDITPQEWGQFIVDVADVANVPF